MSEAFWGAFWGAVAAQGLGLAVAGVIGFYASVLERRKRRSSIGHFATRVAPLPPMAWPPSEHPQ